MDRWCAQQLSCTAEAPRTTPIQPAPPDVPTRMLDLWTATIEAAEAEIRSLIENGDLEHDEITAGWVESWAVDIYHDRRHAAGRCREEPEDEPS